MNAFTFLFRQTRAAHGLTRAEAAKAFGISKSTVVRLENGSEPSSATLESLVWSGKFPAVSIGDLKKTTVLTVDEQLSHELLALSVAGVVFEQIGANLVIK